MSVRQCLTLRGPAGRTTTITPTTITTRTGAEAADSTRDREDADPIDRKGKPRMRKGQNRTGARGD
jgi:hypothetical protein